MKDLKIERLNKLRLIISLMIVKKKMKKEM